MGVNGLATIAAIIIGAAGGGSVTAGIAAAVGLGGLGEHVLGGAGRNRLGRGLSINGLRRVGSGIRFLCGIGSLRRVGAISRLGRVGTPIRLLIGLLLLHRNSLGHSGGRRVRTGRRIIEFLAASRRPQVEIRRDRQRLSSQDFGFVEVGFFQTHRLADFMARFFTGGQAKQGRHRQDSRIGATPGPITDRYR